MVQEWRPSRDRFGPVAASFAACSIAVVLVAVLHVAAPSPAVELAAPNKMVAELETMSHHLIKTDASPAFKSKLAAGKEGLLAKGGLAKQLLAQVDHADTSKGTLAMARKTVNKVFPKNAVRKALNKQTAKEGAKELQARAASVESKEEMAALTDSVKMDERKAASFDKSLAALKAKNLRDQARVKKLQARIHADRNALMSHFDKADQKTVEKAASKHAVEAQERSKAAKLRTRAAQLLAKAKNLAKKTRKGETVLSSQAKLMLKRNHAVIAKYKHLKAQAREDTARAHTDLAQAQQERHTALLKMHQAGSLLHQASAPEGERLSAAKKKQLFKVQADSGRMTRKAVGLLMSTKLASKKAFQLQHQATSDEDKARAMQSLVRAAKMSDRMLRNPGILKNPAELDRSSKKQRARRAQLQRAARLKQRASRLDRRAARLMQAAAGHGRKQILAQDGQKESKQALKLAAEVRKARQVRRQRREQSRAARRLGNEMTKEHQLQGAIKQRQARLRQLVHQDSAAHHRVAFEMAVSNRIHAQ